MKSSNDISRRHSSAQARAGRIGWALMLLILAVVAPSAYAVGDVWFLGIGNDGYYTDVAGLYNALTRMPNADDVVMKSRLYSNHGGSTIRSDISWLANNAQPGDTAIFYYSGHGGTTYDYGRDEYAGWASNSSDETIGRSYSWATDDQIAAALSPINDDVTVVAIFDTCYAGGFVGGTSDLNSLPNVLFMGSSREYQLSYGGYPYSRFTQQLINGIGSSLPADTSDDGIVTFDEWFRYADDRVYGQYPVYFDSGDYGAMGVMQAAVPEPATLSLLAIGGGIMLRRRRRTSNPNGPACPRKGGAL